MQFNSFYRSEAKQRNFINPKDLVPLSFIYTSTRSHTAFQAYARAQTTPLKYKAVCVAAPTSIWTQTFACKASIPSTSRAEKQELWKEAAPMFHPT